MKLKFTPDGALTVHDIIGATTGRDPYTEKLWTVLATSDLLITSEVVGKFRVGTMTMHEMDTVITIERRGSDRRFSG